MTLEEIRAASERVAQHYGIWMPGQTCGHEGIVFAYHSDGKYVCGSCGRMGPIELHEIPCPDLTTPPMFVRLVNIPSYVKWIHYQGEAFDLWVQHNGKEGHGIDDILSHALLKALDALVRWEGEK